MRPRLAWFWRMLVHLVGSYVYVQPSSSSGSVAPNREYRCTEAGCDRKFLSRGGRDKHIKRVHRTNTRIPCRHGCGKSYVIYSESLQHHERTCNLNPNAAHIGTGVPQQHFRGGAANVDQRMDRVHSSVQNNFCLYRRVLNMNRNIFEQVRHTIMYDIRGVLRRERNNVKFYIAGKFIFGKVLRPGVFTDPPIYFNTTPLTTTSVRPIEESLRSLYQDLVEQVNEFIRNGSGWTLRTTCVLLPTIRHCLLPMYNFPRKSVIQNPC